jgi:putative ABC transport system permease protein
MRALRAFFFRIAGAFRAQSRDADFARELESHLALHTDENLRNGVSQREARREALLKFGGIASAAEQHRDRRGLPMLESFLQDIRFAFRTLGKNPGFTAVAILTLALGIGANAALFSVTNAVLLRPLPYPDSDRLAFLTMEDPSRGIVGLNVSYIRLQFLQQQSRTLESVGAAFIPWSSALSTQGSPEQIPSAIATRSIFEALGVAPSTGRLFSADDERPAGPNVVILSDAFWHSHFGGRSDVLGQTLRIDGRSDEIIGVLPPSFRFPFVQPEPLIWLPRVFENPLFPPDRVNSGAAFLNVFARIRAGETIHHVQSELASLDNAYAKMFPGFADAQRVSSRATSLKESLVGPLQTRILVIFSAVGFVLLIVCVNLAALLLARATTRNSEIAIRRAIGASPSRLIRQLMTESLLLSTLGGAAGLAFAALAPRILSTLPDGTLPRIEDIGIDSRVVWFSLALSLLTGLLFGLTPALQSARANLIDALKQDSRGSFGNVRATRTRAILVVAEIAVAVVLVSGAGLLLKSFSRLTRVNPGFDPENVTTLSIALPQTRYPQRAQQAEFYRRLVEEAAALPGVESAGVTSYLPIGGGTRFVYICPEGTVCQGIGKDPIAAVRHISPGYMKTMRVPLLRGRLFNEHDIANSRTVCVINEQIASKFFAGQDPVGKRLIQSRGNIDTEIVGVVGDVRYRGLNAETTAELYVPFGQSAVPIPNMSLVLRSSSALQSLVISVRATVAKLDPDLPLSNIASMSEVISVSVEQPRLTARVVAAFGGLALFLAAMGLYGVMAFSVLQRKQEIAIRVALGASPAAILNLVARQGITLVGAGIAVGLAAALALTRLFSAILFQTNARDPLTLASISILLMLVAMLACYLPARRAMRVDPILALRHD